ncbi:MAG: hypothetical protein QXK71_00835 [Pyrobaculum sp.]|uniref:hypothetical protein n=1 Tax=Pyrobaculum aerophilum TaxID=13773 RepID=UPI0023F15387|nr:hypothetical protein [Pyrobaculum aerophilum]MCX8137588.1 hypothetical protein [Pyrobaculum aerophilum]
MRTLPCVERGNRLAVVRDVGIRRSEVPIHNGLSLVKHKRLLRFVKCSRLEKKDKNT